MPELMLPTVQDFNAFTARMRALGFKEINVRNFHNDLYRLDLQAPRQKKGREVGFHYFSNGLWVKVWTTFIAEENAARPSDLGWVLVTEGDHAKYFAHPMRRTKNFFENLYSYAKACKERIDNRPRCNRKCRRMYQLIRLGNGGTFWQCDNKDKSFHPDKLPTMDWDHGLSLESQKFMEKERAEKRTYRKLRKKKNLSVGEARKIRKKWTMGKPENMRNV